MAKKFRVRRIGITWQDKVVEAETQEQAEELAQCIDGDLKEYQSNFIAEQTEVEVADADEPLTETSDDDEAWLQMYHEQQYRVAQGGA